MHMYLISNCSLTSSGECNADDVISTSTYTFVPSTRTEPVTVSFIDEDIGDVTHFYVTTCGTDRWCWNKFSVLIDESKNQWRDCSFEFMKYMLLDQDCSGNGGLSSITVNISNTSTMCVERDLLNSFSENVTTATPIPTVSPIDTNNCMYCTVFILMLINFALWINSPLNHKSIGFLCVCVDLCCIQRASNLCC